jgi:hypothetical protein
VQAMTRIHARLKTAIRQGSAEMPEVTLPAGHELELIRMEKVGPTVLYFTSTDLNRTLFFRPEEIEIIEEIAD